MTQHLSRQRSLYGIAIVMMSLFSFQAAAQPMTSPQPHSTSMLNVPFITAGGTQIWTDYRNLHDWRIQQNALTGHWRLLDPGDVRRAWGSRENCDAKLQAAIADMEPTATPTKVVILLHGLMRSKHSMRSLAKRLEATADRPHVVSFSYASTRFGIAHHAAALRELVEGLPGKPEIHFVGHSMGNIVVRHAIADWQTEGDPAGVLRRLRGVVMLGPPNQGAAIARRLSKVGLFEFVTGTGGMELGPRWADLEQRLAIPPCPFAIIAGDLPSVVPQNPLVDGNSDFIVSVEETQLPGATEFHTVPHLHSFLMDQRDVQDLVLKFLGFTEVQDDLMQN